MEALKFNPKFSAKKEESSKDLSHAIEKKEESDHSVLAMQKMASAPQKFRRTRSTHNFSVNDHHTHALTSDDNASSHSGDNSVGVSGFGSSLHGGHRKQLTCGIIGGLGPEATIHFMQVILEKTKELYHATADQDHIHTVIEMNPRVPNRNKAIFGTGEDCGPALGQMAANLAAAQVDFVVCACNTAHAFQDDMVKGCGDDVPFLSLIEVTSNTVMKRIRKDNAAMKCGILGGGGCIEAKLYQRSLSTRSIEPILPTPESQDLMQDIIYRIKAGDKVTVIPDFNKILKELKDAGCSQIILGCTELPLIIEDCLKEYDGLKMDQLIDTSANMVETVVRLAKGDLDLKTVLLQCSGIEMEEIESEGDQEFEQSTVHSGDDGSFMNSPLQKKEQDSPLGEVNDVSQFDEKVADLEPVAVTGTAI